MTYAMGDVVVGVLDRSGFYLVVALIVVPLLVLSALLLRVVRRRARSAGEALRAELEALLRLQDAIHVSNELLRRRAAAAEREGRVDGDSGVTGRA